jgi:hypothetical protein
MASGFYDQHLPHYGDLDNVSGTCSGFRFVILEHDGGVGIEMWPADADGNTISYSVFLNVERGP